MRTLFCIPPDMSRAGVCFLVVTRKPGDFPDHIAVRAQISLPGHVLHGRFAGLYETIDEARVDIPDGALRFDRQPEDDPAIAEIWML